MIKKKKKRKCYIPFVVLWLGQFPFFSSPPQIHRTASGEKMLQSVLPCIVYCYGSVMLTEQFLELSVYNFFLICPYSSFSTDVFGFGGCDVFGELFLCILKTLFLKPLWQLVRVIICKNAYLALLLKQVYFIKAGFFTV